MLKSELFKIIYHTIKSTKTDQNIFDETIKQLSIELTEQLIEVFTIANNVDLSNNQIVNCLILEEPEIQPQFAQKQPLLFVQYFNQKNTCISGYCVVQYRQLREGTQKQAFPKVKKQ